MILCVAEGVSLVEVGGNERILGSIAAENGVQTGADRLAQSVHIAVGAGESGGGATSHQRIRQTDDGKIQTGALQCLLGTERQQVVGAQHRIKGDAGDQQVLEAEPVFDEDFEGFFEEDIEEA